MGTNYYWYREDPKNPIENEGLHIGKLSGGWAFHFEAHFDKFQRYKLTSYAAWKEFLKEGFIYNEYGDFYPYKKFIKLIESTREKGKTYKDIPEGEQLHLCDEWEDCGFMFSLGDFC